MGSDSISHVTNRPTEAQRLSDLPRLRRVRDRIGREFTQPLDVEVLARGTIAEMMAKPALSRPAFARAPGQQMEIR